LDIAVVVILGEPEGVLRPYSEELVSITAEASNIISLMLWGCAELQAMTASQAHVCGANRYTRKAVRYGRGMMRQAAGCSTQGAEQEGTIEIQDKEFACRSESVLEGVNVNSR